MDVVGLRRLWALALGLAMLFLVTFLLLDPLTPGIVAEPTWLDRATPAVAAASVALLAGDVVLPVPSSVVMVANGAVFGLLVGTLVSTVGSTLSALVGYAIGRSTRTSSRNWLGSASAHRLDDLLRRHGTATVVATRPIPIVAEVVAILAGQGRLPLGRFLLSVTVGAVGTSVVYAAAGALAVTDAGWVPLAVAAGLAALAWLVGRRAGQRTPASSDTSTTHLPPTTTATTRAAGHTTSNAPHDPPPTPRNDHDRDRLLPVHRRR